MRTRTTLLTSIVATILATYAVAESAKQIDVSAGALTAALQQLARQSGIEFVYSALELEGMTTHGAHGKYTAEEAVKKLLEGTNLELTVHSSGAILISLPHKPHLSTLEDKPDTSGAAANSSSPGNSRRRDKFASFSSADDTQNRDPIEAIVVTANRREESQGRVPISMTALTQSNMDMLGIKDLLDVVRFTPGISVTDNGNFVGITVRGIGSSSGAATTGIYIDDTPLQERTLANSAGSQALPKTFDLDRVEVLRGPQGTLFGAGSEGGTVRYIMNQPSLTSFSSHAHSELNYTPGGAPSYEAGVACGGPLVEETLGVRASVWYRRDGGWIDLVDPTTFASVQRNNNYGETIAARVATVWAASSVVSLGTSFLYQDRKLHALQTYWGILSNVDNSRFISADPSPAPKDDTYGTASLKITADFGAAQLIANTSVFYRQDINGYDGTLAYLAFYQTLGWPPNGVPFSGSACPTHSSCYPFVGGSGVHLPRGLQDYRVHGSFDSKQDAFTQEIRLQSKDAASPFAWTFGTFFSVERTTTLQRDQDPNVDRFYGAVFGESECQVLGLPCKPSEVTPLIDGTMNYLGYQTGHDRQLAGFGEIVWPLTERLRLTTGLRYSRLGFNSTSYADGPINYGRSFSTGSEHEHAWTERLGLAFQLDPGNLYYVTYSTGFRPGGANATIPIALCAADLNSFGITGAPKSYESDAVQTLELGFKGNIENRLKWATSFYHIKWKDIQQSVMLPTCGTGFTVNLGEAASKGADLELEWALAAPITVRAAIGYTDAAYTKSVFAGPDASLPLIAKGDNIVSGQGPLAQPFPPWTIAIGAQYNFHVLNHKSYALINYEFASKNTKPFASTDPRTVQYDAYLGPIPARTFVSARIGADFNKLAASFFVDNLLDSHTITNMANTPLDGTGPQPPVSPLATYESFRPRTFGVSFTYRN